MVAITPQDLYVWCKIPYDQLEGHPQLKVPFRLCRDADEMGALMARELVDEIQKRNQGAPMPLVPGEDWHSFVRIAISLNIT